MKRSKQLPRAFVALFLCLVLAGCAGDAPNPTEMELEICQAEFMADVENDVPIITSIRRYLDCTGLSWLELIREFS